jgi:DNA polymerase elongation subunit (family B)
VYFTRRTELITAYGQYTIKKLEHFVGEDGDTDSLYLALECDELIPEANRGVQLKLERRWKILFLLPNKKRYFGNTGG